MEQKKPIPKNENIVKQDLSAIENKLLECARNSKHVFLHGKNTIDRKAMVGSIARTEFKKHRFIARRNMDGEDVCKELTNSRNGILLKYSGSLFVNNLYCDPKIKEDRENYRKLAKFIRDGDIAVKWLVVYAFNRKNFPDIFKRQFKMISLKSEVEKGCNKEKKKKRRQRIPDNTFRQLCKDVEREYCSREAGERIFFGKLSEVSKLTKYDKTGRGYKTWQSSKKRYYEVFSFKKK
jgi:hypothetical protein